VTARWIAALAALAAAGLAHGVVTPVNANGNGDGAERCLAGPTCAAGAYAGVASVLRAFEIDQGLAAGSLQRVDDALDKRWVALGRRRRCARSRATPPTRACSASACRAARA